MRNLFLLLLLANLGVLAFFSWVVDEPEPVSPYDGPGIVLLREADPDVLANATTIRVPELEAQAPVGALAGANEARPLPARCISIGPFAEADDADSAFATLVAAGFEPSPTTRESEVWDGYWVYIERIDSQASAREIEAELAANGIEDTLILPNSDSGVLLSLGVFSDIGRAGNRAERVNAIGYDATIADSMTTTETHWLDVTLNAEESIALDLLQSPGTISRLEQVACED